MYTDRDWDSDSLRSRPQMSRSVTDDLRHQIPHHLTPHEDYLARFTDTYKVSLTTNFYLSP